MGNKKTIAREAKGNKKKPDKGRIVTQLIPKTQKEENKNEDDEG